MKNNLHPVWFWMPRVMGILFILFISLFALDVFEADLSFGKVLLALLMHLLPSIAMTIALILSWRWEWMGAVGFFGFALWYISLRSGFDLVIYLMLAGLPMLIGGLFLTGWFLRKKAAPPLA